MLFNVSNRFEAILRSHGNIRAMACPYFYPLAEAVVERQPARVPLGVLYQGRCENGGSGQHEACNFGYGRHKCDAFPPDAEADAVRFTALNGKTIYILEQDHLPVRHGEVADLPEPMRRQAEVFQNWLRR